MKRFVKLDPGHRAANLTCNEQSLEQVSEPWVHSSVLSYGEKPALQTLWCNIIGHSHEHMMFDEYADIFWHIKLDHLHKGDMVHNLAH